MLVLTRRADAGDRSTIMIGQDIEVSIVEVHGQEVRIGIAAPPHVSVDRSEIAQAKAEEKRASVATSSQVNGTVTPKITR